MANSPPLTPPNGSRKIQMAVGRANQEINALRTVFLQSLDRVVVSVKDWDQCGFLSRSRGSSVSIKKQCEAAPGLKLALFAHGVVDPWPLHFVTALLTHSGHRFSSGR
jgi:hypothetical protein